MMPTSEFTDPTGVRYADDGEARIAWLKAVIASDYSTAPMKQAAREELIKGLVTVDELITRLQALKTQAYLLHQQQLYIVIKSFGGEETAHFQILGVACHEERLNLDSEDSYISIYTG